MKPPRWPLTSSTSPTKYSPGERATYMVFDDTSSVLTRPGSPAVR
ncbi:hypothetical protein ACPA9J_35255 [Pseudomonas aeruginosa]